MKHLTVLLLLTATAALNAGCGLLGADEAYSLGCIETPTTITLDEATELGFTAADLIAAVEGSYADTLRWSDGTTTGVTLGITYDGGALRFIHSEVETPPEGVTTTDSYPICESRLEIVATVTLDTEDGAFAESFTQALSGDEATAAYFNRDLLPGDLTGTYDFRALDPADFDEVSASLSVSLVGGASTGQVIETGSAVDGEGDDGTAHAEAAIAGEWPAE